MPWLLGPEGCHAVTRSDRAEQRAINRYAAVQRLDQRSGYWSRRLVAATGDGDELGINEARRRLALLGEINRLSIAEYQQRRDQALVWERRIYDLWRSRRVA